MHIDCYKKAKSVFLIDMSRIYAIDKYRGKFWALVSTEYNNYLLWWVNDREKHEK